jgi:site-specific recombinase XerD
LYAHTFRRTFASNLHRKGVDVEHIMRLGGWETLDIGGEVYEVSKI